VAASAIATANATLAEYQRVRTWVLWPDVDFPRTASGKPRLTLIATRVPSLLEAKNAGTIPASAFDNSLLTLIREIAPAASNESLNSLSSLDRAELLSALEQRYSVELNETAFAEAQTIADLHRLVEQPSTRTDYNYPLWAQRAPARWFRLAVYYALVWPATQILAHPRVLGRKHLDGLQGPAIVISNHITRRADIGLILAALPTRFRHRLAIAMGGETLQKMRHPPAEWFFPKRRAYQLGYFLVTVLFNVFPLPQFSGFRESFRFAGESVDRGYSPLIFPEGVVNNSDDGRMAPFQTGIGLLAEDLKLPIIPIRLDGVWQMKQEKRRLARLGEVTVHIGRPQVFPRGTPPAEIARTLQQVVQNL
jgi:long-chain acyl-CoA synthetase